MSDMNISSFQPVAPPATQPDVQALRSRFQALHGQAAPCHEEIREMARDFEGVLLGKLMDEMKKTIPDSGLLSSPTTKQLHGLFWSKLADAVAEQGGIGLADQLYTDFCHAANIQPQPTPARVAIYQPGETDSSPRMECER
jgi:Rod binding domain-containing protein